MQLLLVVVLALVITAFAHRKGLPPSIVIVVLASLASFIPGMPRLDLEPELILSVVLPPLLYSAALDFSVPSFLRNVKSIVALGVGMVVVSTVVTGLLGWWLVPGLTFIAALVLGAVVAPPDAVASLSIGRSLGLPRRLMAILTGESLLNDAAALTLFSLTVAAAAGTRTIFGNPILLFGYGAVVGAVIGLMLGLVVDWLRRRLQDSSLETAVGLLVPFAAYLLAEEVHASGVLAVVAAGFLLGHREVATPFATRLQTRQVWRSVDALLEAFVFAYMGLQCSFIFEDLWESGVSRRAFTGSAAVILVGAVVIRVLWVFAVFWRHNWGIRLDTRARAKRLASGKRPRGGRRGARNEALEPVDWRYSAVISWSGMRGVVTLAAAAGVPVLTAAGEPFPGRELIQALAFVVAAGTLIIQGPTLPILIRALHVTAPEEAAAELTARHEARTLSREAARDAYRQLQADPPDGVDPVLLAQFAERFTPSKKDQGEDERERMEMSPAARTTVLVVRQAVLAAQRTALVKARDDRRLDDEVVRSELERLDYEEAAAAAQDD